MTDGRTNDDAPVDQGSVHPEATAPDPTVPVDADQAEPDQTGPDQTGPDQAEPDQAEPDQAERDQAEPDQAEPEPAPTKAEPEPEPTEPDVARTDPAPEAPAPEAPAWSPRPWEAPTLVMAAVPAAASTPGTPSAAPAPSSPKRISTLGRLDQAAAPGSAVEATTAGLPTEPEPPAAGPPPAAARPTPTPAAALRAPADDRPGPAARGRSDDRADSPMSVFPDQERARRWPRVIGLLAAVVVVLAGVYVGALWLWSDRVPPGSTVAGVEIGTLAADEAVALLQDALDAATTDPIPVAAGDKRTELDPAAAGLGFDAQATVDQLTGFDLQPIRLWHQLVGRGVIEPVTTIDDAALATAVAGVADALATPAVDGSVVFVDGQAQGTEAADGYAVDLEAAQEVLATGWLTAPRPITLETVVVAPVITQDVVDRTVTQIARPLAGAPVTVAVADQLAELPAQVVADAASFQVEGAELVLRLDGAELVEAVMVRTTNLLTSPSDASFAFKNGVPVIVPGVPGTTLDPDALAASVAEAAVRSDRRAAVDLVETDPLGTTAELEALGITAIVSEFSTPLNSEPNRTNNIINGASKLNGMLLRPGETFSLTEALGPVDAEHGFVEAGAIISGEHTDAWGGGLSQLSTTTYNAAFLAGFEDVEHHPHSEWFSRYPEGREATIFTGVLDLQWTNNSPYGALLQSWVEAGRVHVRIWGTPYWTVESTTGPRSEVVQPSIVYSESATCEPQSAGNPGFKVTVTRRVLLAGVEQSAESWTVRYKPQNTVVCGPAPAPPADVVPPAP